MAAHGLLQRLSAPTQSQRPAQELRCLPARPQSFRPAQSVVLHAKAAPTDAPKEDVKKDKEGKGPSGPFQPPTLDASWPAPIFGGSTGGLLRKAQVRSLKPLACSYRACCRCSSLQQSKNFQIQPMAFCCNVSGLSLGHIQVEEFHVITWEAKKEAIFEMPTGGAAKMRQGPNLLKLSRKEQCLALLTQLRNKFKTDGAIYRVFPNGEVQYLHPKDGVYPEKVNKGRSGVGVVDRRIGENTNPVKVLPGCVCEAAPAWSSWRIISVGMAGCPYGCAEGYSPLLPA